MRIILYGNGGCGNHGCEAIVRGTVQLCGKQNDYIVMSDAPEEDYQYELNKIAAIIPARTNKRKLWPFIKAYWQLKAKHDYTAMDLLPYLKPIQDKAEMTDVAFSVGGDNYCYGEQPGFYEINRRVKENGKKLALWGCSIGEEDMSERKLEDLKRFDLILARETLTYNMLRGKGLNNIR